MKKLFTLLFIFSFSIMSFAQTTIDFETVGNTWTWNMFANAGDDPTLYSVVSNPDNTGINTSDSVARLVVNAAADPWAGLWSSDIEDFELNETNCVLKVMVYKDVVSDFGLKLEGDGWNLELKTPGTVANEWEELTFDFSEYIGKIATVIVVLPDFSDPRTAGSTNHWDNITFHPLPSTMFIDFETSGTEWVWTMFSNSDADSTFYSLVDNPDATGINTSFKVAKYVIKDAADPWAGVFSDNIEAFTFDSTNSILTVMVYKDVLSDFTFKFEGDEGQAELKVPNTKTNEWEELTFDFSEKIGTTFKRITIIPDFPATRTVGSTNYWDNIMIPRGNVAPVDPPEAEATTIDYETVGNDWTWNMFANAANDPAAYSVVSNPDNTGINTSDNVAKYVIDPAADPWAGLFSPDIDDFVLDETNCIVKIMVYKDVVSDFGFKLEGIDLNVELLTAGTVANEWEVLTFDFSAYIGKTVTTAVVLPDYSDNPRTYGSINHWDNISFNAQPIPVATINYETVGNDWTWNMFSNPDADPSYISVVSNPDNSGLNTSDSVAKYIINDAGDAWAGVWSPDVDDFVVDEYNSFVKIMVYKEVLSDFGFKFEGAGWSQEVKTPGTVTNEWEELTFDFTESIGKTVTILAVMPDFTDGARTVGSTNYWDNISFNAVEVTTSIDDDIEQINFRVYPNPASNYLFISNISDLKRVDIYSITGQRVRTFEYLNNNIQISELPQGIYVLSAESYSGEVFTTKFFKN